MATEILARAFARFPQGSLLLALISLVNVVLGFAREATIAYFFGASAQLDTFLVALTLPRLIALNAVQITVSVVLPLYVGYRMNGESATATALIRRWFWFSGIVIAVICAVLFVAAEPTMRLLAPGFGEQQRADAAFWLRVLLPFIWLMGVSGAFKVVLDTNRHFGAPQASMGLVSASVIAACAVGAAEMGVGALALGIVGGGLVGFALQLVRVSKFERVFAWDSFETHVNLPVLAGVAMVFQSVSRQIDVLIDRGFASTLQEGSIAALNYAQAINSVPTTIVASALATAIFPTLSEMAAREEWKSAFRTSMRWVSFLVLTVTGPMIILMVYREPIVSLLFQRGSFDATAVKMTASVLSILPLMIMLTGASIFFERLLLAQRQMTAIVIIAASAILAKFVLSYWFVQRWGLLGLVMATVATAFVLTLVRLLVCFRFSATR